jgi:hypothetical protein
MQHIAAKGQHYITEGEKGKQYARRDRQGIDMHLGSTQVAGRGAEEFQARAAFGREIGDQPPE